MAAATSHPVRGEGPPGEVQAIVDRGGPALVARLAAVEQRLREVVGQASGPIAPHASSIIAAGGKRLRPLLVLLAGQAAEGAGAATAAEEEALVRAAVAVELVHSASLVHDDVLDGAPLRRGRPTVVAAGGRGLATAAGDLLFAQAFAELARNDSAAQLDALSSASSALAMGELRQREDAYDVGVALDRYLSRCQLKTARLFEAATRLGVLAVAPGDDGGLADALGRYASEIGLAFQLLDDILDVAGEAAHTGKQRGTDLLDGTITLPLILAREHDAQLAELDVRALGVAEAEAVCDRIVATGVLEAARARALALVSDAKAQLPPAVGVSARELLELVADAVVERYS